MARRFTVADSIVIAADPEVVYEAVSDPRITGRWSPENLGATVRGERSSGVGMQFVGRNRRGRARWVTACQVTCADPSTRFAFEVRAIGARRPVVRSRIATWSYDLERVPEGTRVTETWTDDRRRWPDPVAAAFDRVVTGGSSFADFNARNIHITLRNLKAVLEAS